MRDLEGNRSENTEMWGRGGQIGIPGKTASYELEIELYLQAGFFRRIFVQKNRHRRVPSIAEFSKPQSQFPNCSAATPSANGILGCGGPSSMAAAAAAAAAMWIPFYEGGQGQAKLISDQGQK